MTSPSSQSSETTEQWRDEMYGDEGGMDPFWVPVEASNGDMRDPIDAAALCRGFVGRESFDTGLTVQLVCGRMEQRGAEGWWFVKDVDGEVLCWEVAT